MVFDLAALDPWLFFVVRGLCAFFVCAVRDGLASLGLLGRSPHKLRRRQKQRIPVLR
jgi:hypothetical protein